MQNQVDVFRALSPACSADLAVSYGGRLVSVEVRTAYRLGSGKLCYLGKVNADIFGLYVHEEGVCFKAVTEIGRAFLDGHVWLKRE